MQSGDRPVSGLQERQEGGMRGKTGSPDVELESKNGQEGCGREPKAHRSSQGQIMALAFR